MVRCYNSAEPDFNLAIFLFLPVLVRVKSDGLTVLLRYIYNMGDKNFMGGTILVPIKGVPADYEVVRKAALTCKRNKSLLYLVHVVVVKQGLPLEAEMNEEVAEGEAMLAEAKRQACEYGVPVETGILQARSAGVAIVEEATEREATVIMMAVTYRNRLGEFCMGKTVPYVLKNASCDVWTYRAHLEAEHNAK
jgi:nucleotide-binding universal stress UspA family protein